MAWPPVTIQWPLNTQMLDTQDQEWYNKCTLVFLDRADLRQARLAR